MSAHVLGLHLAVKVLTRKRAMNALSSQLVFTGHLRDRVRRSRATMIVAREIDKKHDNVELIRYVGDTMRALGAELVFRDGIYYYRGVRLADEKDRKPET